MKSSQLHSSFGRSIFLGAATRSPIGRFGGSLKDLSAPQLATLTLKEAILRAPEATPQWVFMGHARQASCGPNPARQVCIGAGISENVPAITINQACASGMSAIFFAAEKVLLGRALQVWAGGVESMSNTPYLLPRVRWGHKMGPFEVADGMYKDGFYCPMSQMIMGETVERFIVPEFGLSRQEQDAFALESQKKAELAWKAKKFDSETFELKLEKSIYREDEHRRGNTTIEGLGKLPPVFAHAGGTITAGNSSGITDGAAFLLVSAAPTPATQAELLDFETVALEPRKMGLGPIECTKRILSRNNLKIQDLESIELNEAFAAQVIACQRSLEIPAQKLNPWGGSIALGHPIGATGCRIVVTLIHQLRGKPGALGLATLCVSGGQGVALLIRRL